MPDKSVSVTAKWEAKNEISLKASMIDGLCWSTFYCGDAGYRIADGEEACAYTATVSDDKIILHMLGRVIPKGTAVIIVGEDNSISMTRDDASAAEYSAVNDLKGVDLPTVRTSLTSNDSYRLYMLSNKNNNSASLQPMFLLARLSSPFLHRLMPAHSQWCLMRRQPRFVNYELRMTNYLFTILTVVWFAVITSSRVFTLRTERRLW